MLHSFPPSVRSAPLTDVSLLIPYTPGYGEAAQIFRRRAPVVRFDVRSRIQRARQQAIANDPEGIAVLGC
jgi:hypothetical protein